MGRSWKRRLATGVVATVGASGGLLLGTAAPVMAAVPVPNGGFEEPEVVGHPGGNFDTFFAGNQVGAWTVVDGSVDLVEEPFWDDSQGDDGDQSLDLNGNEPGVVCQSVPTVGDSEYILTFDLSHNGAFGDDSATATLSVNGEVLSYAHGLNDGESSVQDGGEASYTTQTLSFHTPEGSTSSDICFGGDPDSHPFTGPVIDDVRLNGAPTATIVTPSQFAVYYQGQNVDYDFECTDPDGDEVTCVGTTDDETTVNDGDPIDTSTTGIRGVSLFAEDPDGATASDHATYQVVPVLSGCRGTGAILLNAALGQANPPIAPCVTATKTAVNVGQVIGFPMPSFLSFLNSTLVASVVTGTTVAEPGSYVANGAVAAVKLNIPSLGLNLNLMGVHSSSQAVLADGCDGPATLTGTSRIATLQLNGRNLVLAQGESFLPLPGLGGIRLNQRMIVGNTIIQRAFSLDLPGTALDVVLGESIASAQCAPAVEIPT